jgi:anti-anti-sigma factor
LALHRDTADQIAALQREFELIRRADPDHQTVPHRLLDLIEELGVAFGGVSAGPAAEIEAAVQRGDLTIDLTYEVPPAAGEASRRLTERLDEADEFCRQGDALLTLAAAPEALAYRRWFLGEFSRQCDGEAPRPWPGPVGSPAPAAPPPAPDGFHLATSPDAAVIEVVGPLDLQSAPQLRETVQTARAENPAALVLDLRGCTFVDSVGLSVLVAVHLRGTEDGTPPRVLTSPPVRRLLELNGLIDLLVIDDPADEGPTG